MEQIFDGQNISLGETKEFIPGFLSLTHLRNTGAELIRRKDDILLCHHRNCVDYLFIK